MNRRLYRCRENRVLAGVAAGVAEFFGLDPTLVRVVWFLSIFAGGFTLLLYIALIFIVPNEPMATTTGAEEDAVHNHAVVSADQSHRSVGSGRVSMFLGAALILFGGLALVDIALPGWSMSWRQLWPLVIIGLGGLLIAGALRRERESTDL